MHQLIYCVVPFYIDTVSFDKLQFSHSYHWQVHDLITKDQAHQFKNRGAVTVSIDGCLYPQYKGEPMTLDSFRTLAASGMPYPLISRYTPLGMWYITSITEGQHMFMSNGFPRKIEFTLHLTKSDWLPCPLHF